MTLIYLIRHGETASNAGGRFQGQTDVPLNEAGYEQARLAATALEGRGIGALYTSDLSRAAETARLVGERLGLTPVAVSRLRETHFGAWQGHTWAEIDALYPGVAATFHADPMSTRAPGGESLEDMHARVAEALEAIIAQHPDETVAVIAHGGPIRAMLATVLGTDLRIFPRLRLDNGSLTAIRVAGPVRTVITVNDTCHLGELIDGGDVGQGIG
jgi:alpha-ribazole phosphatase/probable phosphoglycerate mutase